MPRITSNHHLRLGVANIPLILMLALMVIATPLAIKMGQDRVTLQNRAANYLKLGQGDCSVRPCQPGLKCKLTNRRYLCANPSSDVPCQEFANIIRQYCNSAVNYVPQSVPCREAQTTYNQYCSSPPSIAPTSIVYPTAIPSPVWLPTGTPPIPKLTRYPLPYITIAPLPSVCPPLQTKTIDKYTFYCLDDGSGWRYLDTSSPNQTVQ